MSYPFIELQKNISYDKLISEAEYCKANNSHFLTDMIL